MQIVTGEQMRRIDRHTIQELGVPGRQLMEAAGAGVAHALLEDYADLGGSGVVVLCGKGNNGGDGLVAARHLARHGIEVHVLLLTTGDRLEGDAAHNYRAARHAGLLVREIPDAEAWAGARSSLSHPRIVLDAILGTGVEGGARGLARTVIEELNRSGCRVAAIDLPSGINADTPEVEGCAVSAERTYTLCRPKLALVLDPAATRAGIVRVIPIGIPDEAVAAEASSLHWTEAAACARLLPPRAAASHKGDYGHLLAIAGSRDKSGAAVLVARGALRCGVGLVTVATPFSAQAVVASQQAELMTEPLAETADGRLAAGAAGPALELAARRDALAIGPGLGTDEETRRAVRAIVTDCDVPLVIDADGLNALAGTAVLGALAGRPRPAVLTPHPGEAARLVGCTTREVQANRLDAARRLAAASGAVVVLKGRQSVVARPDGHLAVNSTGNPGMATGGTGDVLTGAVGALLARGLGGWDAARVAVYVHGDAGDRAARRVGEDGLIATDLIHELPAACAALRGAGPR